MQEQREHNEKGKKRKKKRSQMQMAKKFARSRSHGSDVGTETYQYMVRILELFQGGFPSEEERLIFVNNVYDESRGHEIQYATNQIGSRVLDTLLEYASLEVIQRLSEVFKDSLRPLSSDRFASHVLQKILLVSADRGNRMNSDAKLEEVQAYNVIVLKLSRYFINNIEEFVFDTYANHILRTVFECLGGLIHKPKNGEKKNTIPSERREVTQEYKHLLVEASERLLKWPQFIEFGKDELTSGFIQSMLYSLKDVNVDTATIAVEKVANECFKPSTGEHLSDIFETESSIRLLEACLAVARHDAFSKIYQKFFKGNLGQLSLKQATNYSVQRLFDHCPSKAEFEEIFQEISPYYCGILEKGYNGVLSSLGNACLRLQSKQGAFMNNLLKTLHCEMPGKQSQVVLCICTLKTPDELEKVAQKSVIPINLHGSLIIQTMLKFNKPIKIVNSLLEMSSDMLLHLFQDPRGSRIADAFMDSTFIGEKSRERLVKKLRGYWSELAKSTHGSRSLERMWQWAQNNQRLVIMEELAALGEALRSTKSGSIIYTKLNVPLFSRSKKDWQESQGKEEKTRALFADIIEKVKKDKSK